MHLVHGVALRLNGKCSGHESLLPDSWSLGEQLKRVGEGEGEHLSLKNARSKWLLATSQSCEGEDML